MLRCFRKDQRELREFGHGARLASRLEVCRSLARTRLRSCGPDPSAKKGLAQPALAAPPDAPRRGRPVVDAAREEGARYYA